MKEAELARRPRDPVLQGLHGARPILLPHHWAQGAGGKEVGGNIFCYQESLTAPDAKTFRENLNTVFSVHSKLWWEKERAHGRGEAGAPR